MVSDNKIANAMSGKTARACDCCIRRRARWYCPADDAFLCQACDGSVHSANPLARRHERVRLKTASFKGDVDDHQHPNYLPSWHRGLTKKPRTPRQGKAQSKSEDRNPVHVIVPELGAEDSTSSSHDGETEEQLLYQVPVFDPFISSEFHSPSTGYEIRPSEEFEGVSDMAKSSLLSNSKSPPDEYLPSDMDLEEFAADVETLLGKGFDDESYSIEELGLLGCSPSNNNDFAFNENNNNNFMSKVVKEEDELDNEVNGIRGCEMQTENNNNNNAVMKEPFELTFDYSDNHDFPNTCQEQEEEDDHKRAMMIEPSMVNELWKVEENDNENDDDKEVMLMMNKRRKVLLRLDYEAISEAWDSQGSPWVNGQRPEIHPDDCWPHCMGACGHGSHQLLYGNHNQMGGIGRIGDGGREARVSRYREKRRKRLFSKKIRYEVRKLNAEKRPRMKGRFVKRSSFLAATTTAN